VDQSTIVPPGMKFSLSAVEASGTQQPPDNYAFVMNVSRLVGAASFTLAKGHELRRANAEEVAVIKATVKPYMVFDIMPWEVRIVDGGASERLPEAEWRYHVISFRGNNVTLIEIEEACSLAPLELKIGFLILKWLADQPMPPGQQGFIMHQGRLFQMLDRALWNIVFSEVSDFDIDAIRTLHSQLVQHDASQVDVRRLVQQLHQLEAVPSYSPLRFLGYFAMLEEVLTHLPKPTDPYESITRQIKMKVALIDHRCKPHIDYSAFGKTNIETIWRKMYAYRSCLAHGGAPDFGSDLQILGNHDRALNLIKQTVKAVLRQALIEPQLIADLRDC
jgi:hypothetical protein